MTVRALRRGTMAGRGVAAGTPATYTIFGDAADGYIQADPRTSADGAGDLTDVAGTVMYVAQDPTYGYEGFIAFDTSVIPDGATITAATLSLFISTDGSDTDFTIEARVYDWGATLVNGDWRSPTTLGTLTLVASKTTAGISTVAYTVLVSDAAFLAAINKTGFTRLILCSSRHRTGAVPTGNEYVAIQSANTTGTTQDPKLVVDVLE